MQSVVDYIIVSDIFSLYSDFLVSSRKSYHFPISCILLLLKVCASSVVPQVCASSVVPQVCASSVVPQVCASSVVPQVCASSVVQRVDN